MLQKVDSEVVFVCGADFLCTDGLQACECLRRGPDYSEEVTFREKLWPAGCNYGYVTESCALSHDAPLRVLPPHDWQ